MKAQGRGGGRNRLGSLGVAGRDGVAQGVSQVVGYPSPTQYYQEPDVAGGEKEASRTGEAGSGRRAKGREERQRNPERKGLRAKDKAIAEK